MGTSGFWGIMLPSSFGAEGMRSLYPSFGIQVIENDECQLYTILGNIPVIKNKKCLLLELITIHAFTFKTHHSNTMEIQDVYQKAIRYAAEKHAVLQQTLPDSIIPC